MALLEELVSKFRFEADTHVLHNVEEHLEGIERKLGFLGAVEIVKGIFELTERFGEFAESLVKGAAAAGITGEEFQKLAFSASQSGVSQQEMSQSLTLLSRQLYAARKGSKEAAQAFANVGISMSDVQGFATSEDALKAVADGMRGIQDPIARSALTMKLLGRGSRDMAAWLNKGSQSMSAAEEEAERLGAVLSDDQLTALEDVTHSLMAFAQVVKTVGAGLVANFAPSIQQAVAVFLEFYRVNKDILGTSFSDWAGDLSYVLGYITGIVLGLTQRFLNFAKTHRELVSVVGDLAIALGGVATVLGPLGLAISGVSFAFKPWGAVIGGGWKALNFLKGGVVKLLWWLAVATEAAFPAFSAAMVTMGAFIEATPVGWLIAGIAAVVLAAYGLYKTFQSLWQHFSEGVPWADTPIGKFFSALEEKYKWAKKVLGFASDAGPTMDKETGLPAYAKKKKTPDDQRPEGPYADIRDEEALRADVHGLGSDKPLQLDTHNLDALQASRESMPSSTMDPSARMPVATGAPVTQNITVNNPVSLAPNMPPDKAQAAMTKGVSDGVGRAFRQAASNQQPQGGVIY